MKSLFKEVTEKEKKRILEMHYSHNKKTNYVFEQNVEDDNLDNNVTTTTTISPNEIEGDIEEPKSYEPKVKSLVPLLSNDEVEEFKGLGCVVELGDYFGESEVDVFGDVLDKDTHYIDQNDTEKNKACLS